jgi:predicted deacetylase
MANQTFKVAGITVHNGNAKVRFTDDMVRRVKQFSKGGASRIDLVELPSEMTKLESLAYLQAHVDFQSAGDQATISDAITDRTKEANKGTVKVRATKAKAKPSIDAIKARAKKTKEVTAEELLKEVGVAPM